MRLTRGDVAGNVTLRGLVNYGGAAGGWALPYTSRISVVRVGAGDFRHSQSDHGYQPPNPHYRNVTLLELRGRLGSHASHLWHEQV